MVVRPALRQGGEDGSVESGGSPDAYGAWNVAVGWATMQGSWACAPATAINRRMCGTSLDRRRAGSGEPAQTWRSAPLMPGAPTEHGTAAPVAGWRHRRP